MPGHRVQVYRNVHKPGFTYSIRSKDTNLVLGHATQILLSNCKMVVQEAGRRRVLETRKKSVHAWIEGQWCPLRIGDESRFKDGQLIQYNPYQNETFVGQYGPGTRVDQAQIVYIEDDKLWAHY